MSNVKDLRGLKFGSLSVVKLNKVENYKAFWECNCSCGNNVVRSSSFLKSKKSNLSCGCSFVHGRSTHGESKTPLYAAWAGMKNRCRPNGPYASRGIGFSDNWRTFDTFKSDMGKSFKEGLSLDRVDNLKGYSKDNCRWVTPSEQRSHSSKTIRFTYRGNSITLKEASDMTGLKVATIRARLKSGWSPNDIINRRPSDPSSMMQPLFHE